MKKIGALIFLIITNLSFSQKRDVSNFAFNDIDIEFSRLDYSQYGLAQIFVTVYDNTDENTSVENNVITCLSNYDNIYHTYFYFLKIPKNIVDENEKHLLFSTFLNHLYKEERIKKADLYLNFDSNYATNYLSTDTFKRLITNINSNNICNYLFIK